MNAKLYRLHQTYNKHAGVSACAGATGVKGIVGHVNYCAGCGGFFIVGYQGEGIDEIRKTDTHCPSRMGPWLKQWRQFARARHMKLPKKYRWEV